MQDIVISEHTHTQYNQQYDVQLFHPLKHHVLWVLCLHWGHNQVSEKPSLVHLGFGYQVLGYGMPLNSLARPIALLMVVKGVPESKHCCS